MKRTEHEYIDGKECKQCSVCKILKQIDQFPKNKKHTDGLDSPCKECKNAWHRQHRQMHRDVYINKHREYYNNPKGKITYAISTLRRRAKMSHLPFDELCAAAIRQKLLDIYTNGGICPYCGKAFDLKIGKRNPQIPSVDRWDSRKGYEMGNVIICCWKCNHIKNACTIQMMQTILNAQNQCI